MNSWATGSISPSKTCQPQVSVAADGSQVLPWTKETRHLPACPLHLLLTSPSHSVLAAVGSLLFFKMPSTLASQTWTLLFLWSGMCFPRYVFGSHLITCVSTHMSPPQRGLPRPTSKRIGFSLSHPLLLFLPDFLHGT